MESAGINIIQYNRMLTILWEQIRGPEYRVLGYRVWGNWGAIGSKSGFSQGCGIMPEPSCCSARSRLAGTSSQPWADKTTDQADAVIDTGRRPALGTPEPQ